MRLLLRGGYVNRHNYANPGKPEMYRCCLPGCGGAALNSTKIRQALRPQCRAFHNAPEVRLVIHFELQKGWDFICIPETPPGMPPPGYSTPGVSEAGDQAPVSTEIIGISQEIYRQNAVANDPRKKTLIKERKRIMAMRNKKLSGNQSMLTAEERRAQSQLLMERIEQDQKHTGVYHMMGGGSNKGLVQDCGGERAPHTNINTGNTNTQSARENTELNTDACFEEPFLEDCNLEADAPPEVFHQALLKQGKPGSSDQAPTG